MQKPAPSDFPVHELIRERWSPRAFADKPVHKTFCAAFSKPPAGRLPAITNSLGYIVATKDDREILRNAERPRRVQCPVGQERSRAGARCREMTFAKNNAPNRNAQYDTGAATALLSVEAPHAAGCPSNGRI